MNQEQPICKWSFTQTQREMDCPKCGEKAGDTCRTPKGRVAWPPHWQRGRAYFDKIGLEEFNLRHAVQVEPLDLSRVTSIVVMPSEYPAR